MRRSPSFSALPPPSAAGTASKELTLDRSLTVYKDWAQGLFDGIVTN